ncbi:SHOCT domain-containing protein [Synechococcus sp. LTW-R]|nr:SHOCT domain-containing protein [Synechococcus sp. LTW-R]
MIVGFNLCDSRCPLSFKRVACFLGFGAMKDQGLLTEEEFSAAKAKLLGQ